jgi:hypothetical protein
LPHHGPAAVGPRVSGKTVAVWHVRLACSSGTVEGSCASMVGGSRTGRICARGFKCRGACAVRRQRTWLGAGTATFLYGYAARSSLACSHHRACLAGKVVFVAITSSAPPRSVLGHGEIERPCSLHVDDQLELGWLLHRQIGSLLAPEYPIEIVATCRKCSTSSTP